MEKKSWQDISAMIESLSTLFGGDESSLLAFRLPFPLGAMVIRGGVKPFPEIWPGWSWFFWPVGPS